MNARNYAVTLINEMNNVDLNCKNESMCMLYPHAIECALIAVDNIMEVLHSDEIYNPGMLSFDRIENYWNEVKKEILTIKNK